MYYPINQKIILFILIPSTALCIALAAQRFAENVTELCNIVVPPMLPPRQFDWIPMANSTNTECQKFVYVPFALQVGLGHRISNWLQGYLISLVTGFPRAFGSHFNSKGFHSTYSDAAELLGLNYGLRNVDDLIASSFKKVLVKGELRNGSIWQDVHVIGKLVKSEMAKSGCNSIAEVQQFWPSDYSLARPALVASLHRGLSGQRAYLFDDQCLAVAVHLRYITDIERVGTVNMTWEIDVVRNIAKHLSSEKACFKIYAFSAVSTDEAKTQLADKMPNGTIFIGSDKANTVTSFYHFLASDILVCPSSSLCWIATYASSRPLSIREWPAIRENYVNPCIAGSITCQFLPHGDLTPHTLMLLTQKADMWKTLESHNCVLSRVF